MSDNLTTIDDEETPIIENDAEANLLKTKFVTIKQRCEAANIDFIQEDDPDFGISAYISLPAGKGFRRVHISTLDRAVDLIRSDFEKIRFLPGYDAIWHPHNNYIEAAIQTTIMNPDRLIRRIKGIPFNQTISPQDAIIIHPHDEDSKPMIEIGLKSSLFNSIENAGFIRYSIKISNIRAKTADQAIQELKSYTNSLFFQIDLIYGYSFLISRERRISGIPLSKKMKNGVTIEYPSIHFNDDAISLYWYGKTARGMPLLQYLAFYQCIEFYFPRYSQLEARKRISALLKRPTFRPSRDDDLDTIIAAVQSARSGGFGSERNQLRSVINECISADEMREYIQSDPDRLEHFSGKSKSKFHKIPVANKSSDLRNDIADRIYDIRCKIVHTKNDEADSEIKMILPFSEDAQYLIQDVELAEFISRNVLSSSSSELD